MKVLRIIAVVIAISVASRLINLALTPSPEFSQNASQNTARNGAKVQFVQGCHDDSKGATLSRCECAFDALDKHYGYAWYEDKTLINRLLKDGYNYEETQAITSCAVPALQTQTN